jgi:hypothetical protein
MSAFYLPVLLMLAGLILRGVAFEFRRKTQRMRWIWNASFAGGSLVATFTQGVMVGALVEGLPLADGHYVGGELGWLSPFTMLCGVGLCVGYALLGACWLVRKCEGEVRDEAYRLIPYFSIWLLVFLAVVFVYALVGNLEVMRRWLERPYLFVFPVIGALATITLAQAFAVVRMDTLRHGGSHFHSGIRAASDLVLALHDPFRYHCRGCAGPSFQPRPHVLGGGAFRLPPHAGLHCDQSERVQRQGKSNRRPRQLRNSSVTAASSQPTPFAVGPGGCSNPT